MQCQENYRVARLVGVLALVVSLLQSSPTGAVPTRRPGTSGLRLHQKRTLEGGSNVLTHIDTTSSHEPPQHMEVDVLSVPSAPKPTEKVPVSLSPQGKIKHDFPQRQIAKDPLSTTGEITLQPASRVIRSVARSRKFCSKMENAPWLHNLMNKRQFPALAPTGGGPSRYTPYFQRISFGKPRADQPTTSGSDVQAMHDVENFLGLSAHLAPRNRWSLSLDSSKMAMGPQTHREALDQLPWVDPKVSVATFKEGSLRRTKSLTSLNRAGALMLGVADKKTETSQDVSPKQAVWTTSQTLETAPSPTLELQDKGHPLNPGASGSNWFQSVPEGNEAKKESEDFMGGTIESMKNLKLENKLNSPMG